MNTLRTNLAFTWAALTATALLAAACAEDVPAETGGKSSDAPDAALQTGDGGSLPEVKNETPGGGEPIACGPAPDDYLPRDAHSANDAWPACISDDNRYHRIEPNISTIGRVEAFERIAQLLFTGSAPSPQDFVDAKLIYGEEEGLGSRLARREDEHYPAGPKACQDMTEAELQQFPDRCVGPAQMVPLLNQAFADGAAGIAPLHNAYVLEAVFLWFFYVSSHKEATTCAGTPKDCDSSYAYYTGGEDRDGGLGLARYVRSLNLETHQCVWDGILAVRCWRDLDPPAPDDPAAKDLGLRDRAIGQLDRALLHGLATIVRSRLQAAAETGDSTTRDVLFGFVKTLGKVLLREAKARDPGRSVFMETQLELSADHADFARLAAAYAAVFPCP